MNTNRTTFLNSLNKSNVSSTVKDAILARYDMLVDNFGEEGHDAAYKQYLPESVLMEAKAAIDCSPPNPEIMSALTEANKHTIVKDPKARVRRAVENFNKNLHRCNVEVTNAQGRFTALSPDEITALEQAVPFKQKALDKEYQSWASFKEGRANLQ